MKRHLVKERRAEGDIDSYLDFLIEEEAFDSANRFIDELENLWTLLLHEPEIAPHHEIENSSLRGLDLHMRPLVHGFPHNIYYYLTKDEVRIYRVLHGSMDQERHLPNG